MRVVSFIALSLAVFSFGCHEREPDRTSPVPEEKAADKNSPPEEANFLEPSYLPGGTADFTGKIGYLCNPNGGIDAVDLGTGKTVWHSDEASFPLVVYKGIVLALEKHGVNPFRIVGLSTTNGKRAITSDSIEADREFGLDGL